MDISSLDNTQLRALAKKLQSKIEQYNYEYYVLDAPSISDQRYDELLALLIQIQQSLGLPLYQNVGASPKEGFAKVEHQTQMLSLNNAFTQQELEDFTDRIITFLKL